jgi:hypothetical protein
VSPPHPCGTQCASTKICLDQKQCLSNQGLPSGQERANFPRSDLKHSALEAVVGFECLIAKGLFLFSEISRSRRNYPRHPSFTSIDAGTNASDEKCKTAEPYPKIKPSVHQRWPDFDNKKWRQSQNCYGNQPKPPALLWERSTGNIAETGGINFRASRGQRTARVCESPGKPCNRAKRMSGIAGRRVRRRNSATHPRSNMGNRYEDQQQAPIPGPTGDRRFPSLRDDWERLRWPRGWQRARERRLPPC